MRGSTVALLALGFASAAGCSGSVADDGASGSAGTPSGGSAKGGGGGGTAKAGGSGSSGAAANGGQSAASGRTGAGRGAGRAGSGTGGGAGSGAGSAARGGTTSSGGTASSGAAGDAPSGGAAGSAPAMNDAGWLYTTGNKIMVSDGNGGGTPWVGRGVNVDDLFLCGYNGSLWMDDSEQTLTSIVAGAITDWKATFLRLSLSMATNPTTVSWFSNQDDYRTPITNVIKSIGTHPNVYVLVSLRSDSSMIGYDEQDGDPEATGLPSDSTTTPDDGMFPTGTDAVYEALVETFADDKFVLFGLTNEPGGNKLSNQQISAAMSHAVSTIRAKEDALGVPHHLVSVQGNSWTSDLSVYGQTPLTQDNVIYEVHGYPPGTSSYTYANLPVIIGEYGSLDDGSATAFYADVESKQLPNLAWDFEPYSNCAPDLVDVDNSPTNLKPSNGWGTIVKAYLQQHAP